MRASALFLFFLRRHGKMTKKKRKKKFCDRPVTIPCYHYVIKRKEEAYRMKKVYHAVTTIILIVLIIVAAIMTVPRLFGMTPMAVLSGSMEPTFHVGSLVFVKQCDPSDVKQGDPITFKISADTVVTHRVISIDTVNQCFYTKGDANNTPDGGSVSYDNLLGKAVFTIPQMGYLAVYAQSKSGIIVLVTIILVVLILTFVPDLFFKDDDEGKKQEEDKDGKAKKRKKK